MADQAVDKAIESEAKALKSAEAAFEAASAEIAKPVKAAVEAPAKTAEAVVEAAPAPAPVKKAPAKARKAKPAARPVVAKAAAKPAPKKIVTRKTNRKAPVRKAAAPTQGVKTMTSKTKTAENIFGADRFQAAFGEINERAKAATEKTAKIAEELTDLTRGNVEAIVASSKVAQKGLETLGQTAADFGRKSFEDAQNVFKTLGEVRSATDFFKLQGDYARGAFDAAIAESARVSEAMLKIANDAAEPLTSRYTVAAERVKTLVAA